MARQSTFATNEQIASWSEKLRGQTAEAIIAWSMGMFGKRIAIPLGLNAGGMVILHKVFEVLAFAAPPHVFTIDTGMLFPETPALIEQCNKRYGIKIEVVSPDPREVKRLTANRPTDFFLHNDANGIECCDVRKVRPYARILRERNYAACITGMLRDGDRPSLSLIERDRHNPTTLKVNPLAFWTREEVWDEIYAHGLPYHPQLDEFPHLACKLCTEEKTIRNGRRECGINGEPRSKDQRLITITF